MPASHRKTPNHKELTVQLVRDWVRRANRPSLSPFLISIEVYYFVTS